MQTATLERPQTEDVTNIFEKATCLSLTLRRLGVRRKVQLSELKPGIDIDTDAVSVNKAILECPEYDAIVSADGELRRWLESRTSGPALFKNGVYMLSYAILKDVDNELAARLEHRANVLVPAFVAVYERVAEGAKLRLGPLHHAEEYPAVADVERAFSATTRYFSLGAPSLEKIGADIFAREQAKAADQWADVLTESRNVLRAEFAGLVDHLVERLTTEEGGKKKRFNATLVENLDDFLKTFNARDISNDVELSQTIERARAALRGVDAQKLRDQKSTRTYVAEVFRDIKATTDSYVERKGRRFDLAD